MKYEFEVKFYVLDKPFKTTVLAESQADAEKVLKDFILSKIKVVSAQKKKNDWNELIDETEKILSVLSK